MLCDSPGPPWLWRSGRLPWAGSLTFCTFSSAKAHGLALGRRPSASSSRRDPSSGQSESNLINPRNGRGSHGPVRSPRLASHWPCGTSPARKPGKPGNAVGCVPCVRSVGHPPRKWIQRARCSLRRRPESSILVGPGINAADGGVVAVIAGSGGAFAIRVHRRRPAVDPAAHGDELGFHALEQTQ